MKAIKFKADLHGLQMLHGSQNVGDKVVVANKQNTNRLITTSENKSANMFKKEKQHRDGSIQ